MAEQVSAFPPIQMHVYPDTSGEVKVSGQITPISPTGNSEETMLQLIGVATDTAQKLGRPVQVTATDAAGTRSVLLVDTDGNVTDLAAQGRRRGGTAPPPEAPALITVPPPPVTSAADVARSTILSFEPADPHLEVPATDPVVIDRAIPTGAPGQGTTTATAGHPEMPALVTDTQGDPAVTRRSLRDTTFLVDDTRPAPAAKGFRGLLTRVGITSQATEAELAERADIAAVSRHWPGTRTISVVNRKGGSAKTPVVAGLSAVFGRYGGGGVLAWDNNENSGTLPIRTEQEQHGASVLDLLRDEDSLLAGRSHGDIAGYVHHQQADRYDVLWSDQNDFGDHEIQAEEVHRAHNVAERYYRMLIMDSGNTARAANWKAMIELTSQLVIATTTGEDRAELGSRTLQTIAERDEHGARLAENAVVIVSCWKPEEAGEAQRIASLFEPLVRSVVIIPFDHALKAGKIRFDSMRPATQRAWLAAAAAVARGL